MRSRRPGRSIVALLCALHALPAAAATPVIFDTDIGTDIDDAYALVALMRRPELEVLGITTVSSDAAARARLAAKLLSIAGGKWRQVPVHAGISTATQYMKQVEWAAGFTAPNLHESGGVEFMRAFAEKTYGIPPEQVVGSQGKLKYELRNGNPVLVKLPEVQFINDKEGKPAGIQTFIGRRPIAAFGNSDGDLQMLQWTTAGSGPRFALIVHHTDAEREWAYDRSSHIGKLDKALDEGQAKGWTIVDMKKDWKRIFPFEK